ncbi:MAG: YxiJ family protein [Bacillota bacterium]
MDEINSLIQQIREIYSKEGIHPFPYENLAALREDLEHEFKRFAPNESISADLNTYWMFISGLSSGGIERRLTDALERYNTKLWLEKSFFDWFPKYRFLEKYDLSDYTDLDRDLKLYDKLRKMLLNVIKLVESNKSKELLP